MQSCTEPAPPTGISERTLKRWQTFSQAAAGLVILAGVLTLIGWSFNLPTLKKISPGLVSMKVNSALCFICCGASLLLQRRGPTTASAPTRLAKGLGLLVATVGALTLLEYLLHRDIGLDNWLFRESAPEAGTSFPGRMSPTSAVNFLLLGLALQLLDFTTARRGRWPAQFLALATLVTTLLAFIGYFYGVETLAQIAPYVTIALHSVLGFGLLSLSVLFARPQRGLVTLFLGESPGSMVARRMLPAAILVPLLAGWLRVLGQRQGLFGLGFGSASIATALIIIFTSLVVWAARVLNRIDQERQRGAAELLESRRQEHARRVELEALMEATPAIIWIAQDPAGQLITGNGAAQHLLRVPAGRNVSKTSAEAAQLEHFQVYQHNRLLPQDRLPMQLACHTGQPVFESELELRFSDGTTRWIFGNAVPLRRPDGAVRGALSAFVDITALKHAEQELRDSREKLRALAARLQDVREQERTEIAREIHDVLAQELTRLKLNAVWLSGHLKPGPETAQAVPEKLTEMCELIDLAIECVQRIATELRPVVLDSFGLCAAVEWQVTDFQKRTGLHCRAVVPEGDLELDRSLSTALFRILQESLTNVARHAQAQQVEVTLTATPRQVTLSIRDDGRGILPAELADPHSVGLLGMRERASLLGGHCRISGQPDHGTEVVASFPLPPTGDRSPLPS